MNGVFLHGLSTGNGVGVGQVSNDVCVRLQTSASTGSGLSGCTLIRYACFAASLLIPMRKRKKEMSGGGRLSFLVRETDSFVSPLASTVVVRPVWQRPLPLLRAPWTSSVPLCDARPLSTTAACGRAVASLSRS